MNAQATYTRTPIVDATALLPGRYMATQRVPLLPPFDVRWMEPGQMFEVLDRSDDTVLIAFQDMKVWKRESHFCGKVEWHGQARNTRPEADVLIDRLIHDAAIAEERIPLDELETFAREMGVSMAHV